MDAIFFSDINQFKPVEFDGEYLCSALWMLNSIGLNLQKGATDILARDAVALVEHREMTMKLIQQLMSAVVRTHDLHFVAVSPDEWHRQHSEGTPDCLD